MDIQHNNIKGKNIVVTGASKGMGKAIAAAFAADGAHLFLCARNAAQLNKTVAELQLQYPEVVIKSTTARSICKRPNDGFWQMDK